MTAIENPITVLPIQTDAPADTIKVTTRRGVGREYCFRCFTKTGELVKSSNGKNGICKKHGGTAYRAPSGMKTCIKCKRIFRPMTRENSCNKCVSPEAVARRNKSVAKRSKDA